MTGPFRNSLRNNADLRSDVAQKLKICCVRLVGWDNDACAGFEVYLYAVVSLRICMQAQVEDFDTREALESS